MSSAMTVAVDPEDEFVQPTLDEFEQSLHLAPDHPPITPEQSPQDPRSYRVITLSNGLTALLVSDAETDKAAASLDVNIGSFAEPTRALGLAHFLEHMLFMGTERYPNEQEYSLAINNFGGSQNAFTTLEHTNYIFDVTPDHLEEILDRFAQFFVSPLCLKSAVDRELLAVNNEHEKNLQSDVWRIAQLSESTLNPAHPISRFATGNFETLRDAPKAAGFDIRDELLSFYHSHYCAGLMKLCVIGREPLDQLEQWVRRSFSDVKNLGRGRPDYRSIPLALPEHTATITRVVPVKNHRSLELEWLLPPCHHQYLSRPGKLLAHCWAHEAEGSLAHVLKQRSLINELRASSPEENSSYSVFSVQLELTESGLAQVDQILELAFAYVAMLQRSLTDQPEVWRRDIYEEVKAVQEMEFLFREKIEPIYFAEDLAGRLSSVPAALVLSNNRLRAYSHAQLTDLVAALASPANMRVRVIAPEYKQLAGLQKERWYGTEYTLEKLDAALLARLAAGPEVPEFHLPKRNPFVATDFSVKHSKLSDADRAKETAHLVPKRIECGCHTRPADASASAAPGAAAAAAATPTPSPSAVPCSANLFHHPDVVFEQPKVHITIQLATSLGAASPRAQSLAALWQDLIDDDLSSVSHYASEGLLGSYCWPSSQGLMLSFNGFNDKLPLLVNTVLPKLRGMRVAGERESQFARLKEQMQRSLTQYNKSTPLSHARDDSRAARLQTHWSVDEQLESFDSITAADVDEFAAEWLAAAQIFVLVSGNMREAEARQFCDQVAQAFQLRPLPQAHIPSQRCVLVPADRLFIRQQLARNPDESNSCVLNVYQIGQATDELEAHLTLLAHILSDALFDQLRTKETLGYLVQGFQGRLAGVLHYQIAVQSSDADGAYLDHRVEAFLAWFRSFKLADLIRETADFIEQNKKAVVANLTEKDKNIGDAHNRHWGEIEKRRYDFRHQDKVAAAVSAVTLDSLLSFWDKFIGMGGSERRKMSFQYSSHAHTLPPRLERQTEEAAAYANQKVVLRSGSKADAAAPAVTESDAAAPAVTDAAATPAAEPEEVFLPPVVLDPRPITYIDDILTFKNGCMLFPAGY